MSKKDILKANGTYNANYSKVTERKFLDNDFYDPMDLFQVKYEMLREALDNPSRSIGELAHGYGFSRAAFYKIKEAYQAKGTIALIPDKSGPKQAYKLTGEYQTFIDGHPGSSSEELRLLLKKEKGLDISRRTIERYRSRKKLLMQHLSAKIRHTLLRRIAGCQPLKLSGCIMMKRHPSVGHGGNIL